jgi:hypothetical protein
MLRDARDPWRADLAQRYVVAPKGDPDYGRARYAC